MNMVLYYRNPKTGDLIVYEPDKNELLVLEEIKGVRVFTEADVTDPIGDAQTKPTGHRKKKISPETIAKMKQLKSEGHSIADIAEEVGVSYPTVIKHLK